MIGDHFRMANVLPDHSKITDLLLLDTELILFAPQWFLESNTSGSFGDMVGPHISWVTSGC